MLVDYKMTVASIAGGRTVVVDMGSEVPMVVTALAFLPSFPFLVHNMQKRKIYIDRAIIKQI